MKKQKEKNDVKWKKEVAGWWKV